LTKIAKLRKRAVSCTARSLFLFLFFEVDHLTAFVVAAARAHAMWQAHLATVATLYQGLRGQRVMGAPAVTSAGRVFSLGMGGHALTPVSISKIDFQIAAT
jgi:hypothetical protein